MIKIILNLIQNFKLKRYSFISGVTLDERNLEEKKEDIKFSDIVAHANETIWIEKDKTAIRKFPELNQNNTSGCGAWASAKALGVLFSSKYNTYVPFLESDIYKRRMNKPTPGMALYDMIRIWKEGVIFKENTDKNPKNDTESDSISIQPYREEIRKLFSISEGVYIENNIDIIASTIQTTGKGIILLTYFLADEWSKEIPAITNKFLSLYDNTSLRHYVTAVDFTLINGKKYLVIEDSAWFGGINRRFLSEEWITQRVTTGVYPMNFRFSESENKPKYNGTIISFQECMKSIGLFPKNIDTIEKFGPLTKQACVQFQTLQKLTITGIIDTATISRLKVLFK